MAGGAVALASSNVSLVNSRIAHNAGGQCGGGLFTTTLPGLSLWEAAGNFNMSGSILQSNTAQTGGGMCSKGLEIFSQGDAYDPLQTARSSTIEYLSKLSLVRGFSSIRMVNSTFQDNTGDEGWDVYANNATSIWFGPGLNIHTHNASVLWKRNCTIGEVPVGDGSCLGCPAFSYSLSVDVTVGAACKQCPPSTQCPGGALVTPLSGFWHAHGGTESLLYPTSCSLIDVIR